MVELLLTLGLLLFGGGLGAGLFLALRRPRAQIRSMSGAPFRIQSGDLERAARQALVRMDDRLADARRELDFAEAQFGASAARAFAADLERAEAKLREAFQAQHRLDDEIPETDNQRRQLSRGISALCDGAEALVAEHIRGFETRRKDEARAPETLASLRAQLDALPAKVTDARTALEAARASFGLEAVAEIAGHPAEAERELAEAERLAAEAEQGISAAVRAVTDLLHSSREHAWRAEHLLTAVTERAASLAASGAALLETAAASGERARAVLAALPADAEQAAVVKEAAEALLVIATGHAAPTARKTRRAAAGGDDPAIRLDRLRQAEDALDVAISGARSQQQRLAGARSALGGALAAARSHIGIARQLIDEHRGRVGSEARSRLAEAERQLGLAEQEADPVIALDTARRAGTLATDADALARYDLL